MFNDRYGLTQAVLNGSKTMTRRAVPKRILDEVEIYQEAYYNGTFESISEKDAILAMCTYEELFNLPYQVGEVVAIAQSYKDCLYDYHTEVQGTDALLGEFAGWDNKMFVKAEFMPHHIRITNIRVERLQDISDEDCMREGIYHDGTWYRYANDNGYASCRNAFSNLIDKVSCKGTWESNPYVFVYEFELVD